MSLKKHTGLSAKALPRAIMLGVADVLAVAAAFFAALLMRFDFQLSSIPKNYLQTFANTIGPWCAICVVVFIFTNLYNSIWSFASVDEVLRILFAYAILLVVGLGYNFLLKVNMPRSYYVLGFVFSLFATTAIRFSYRLVRGLRQLLIGSQQRNLSNIMIIGAGEAGRALATELTTSEYVRGRVVCVIDDNAAKWNKLLCGVPIVGGRQDIPEAARQYRVDKIIYAIPTAPAAERKAILDICSTTGCQVQVLPGMYQMVNEEVSVSALREVDPLDLLGRDPIKVNVDEILNYISGKVVMVTGGGGSIGSELCRQIARAKPKQLIIFEIYENNAYDIQNELIRKYPELNLEVLIGSVRNTNRVNYVVSHY